MPVGGLILGAALALAAQATTLWRYYLALGVLGAAGIGGIQTPAAAIVNRWFVRSRGAAMGVVSAGASASAIIFYPLNTWLIVTWRLAFAVFDLVLAVVTIPLATLLYRNPPDEVDDRRAPSPPPTTAIADDWTLGVALHNSSFWAAFAMWGLGVVGYQIVTTRQVAPAVERGFSPVTLGWVFGLGGVCPVAGNLVGGALSDRWGRESAGIGALAWLDGPNDLLGGFIGPFFGGWLFDIPGNYQIAFAAAALAIAASAVAAWVEAPRKVSRAETHRP